MRKYYFNKKRDLENKKEAFLIRKNTQVVKRESGRKYLIFQLYVMA